MTEKFLEPQNPLKKIDETTGDVTYVYPLTTDKQVMMENGERLNTVLKENILYIGETAEESVAEIINADTWSGHTPSTFLNLVYPIGSIYMSMNNVDPANLFGGTWSKIEDRFLLAASSTYGVGATGGEAEHTLTVNEMPSHSHDMYTEGGNPPTGVVTPSKSAFGGNGQNRTSNPILANGGSQPHNNMPPYLAVYVWQRIS